MKLLALVKLAEHNGIERLQEAMQLAARTTNGQEMNELRAEIRTHSFCDATTMPEIRQKLAVSILAHAQYGTY